VQIVHPSVLWCFVAQVLLLYNVDVLGGLANGTRGVVEGFVGVRDYLKQVSTAAVLQLPGHDAHTMWLVSLQHVLPLLCLSKHAAALPGSTTMWSALQASGQAVAH
jgi:hypothetical protein